MGCLWPFFAWPYIFDRYYRSRSDAGKQGTGLGLSITKAIFQQHGFRSVSYTHLDVYKRQPHTAGL